MTDATTWYSITPAGPVAIGNLTPVGQNSGQVGCRWPPNGHHLAGCLGLPQRAKLWGPFWYNGTTLYGPVPQTVYALPNPDQPDPTSPEAIPQAIFRLQWREGYWQPLPQHQGQEIELLGGRYLMPLNSLRDFWPRFQSTTANLVSLPWRTLTLSHNSRDNFQVLEEGGFFAEMTTLLDPGWSLALRITGDFTPPPWSTLGAGGTPVVIAALRQGWDWLGDPCPGATGAVLLTSALWSDAQTKCSRPYPDGIQAYAATTAEPWQTWKRVPDRKDPRRRVSVLTPGEWLTPAGAVYLWPAEAPLATSGPSPDPFQRHALGYGHLWLFKETTP